MKYIFYDSFWWKYDTSTAIDNATIYNFSGGKQSGIDASNCKIAQAKDWKFLDWSGTSIYDNKTYKTGWINPQGKFWGCDYYNHNLQAKFVHSCTEIELEQKGWVKISKDMYTHDLIVKFNWWQDKVLPTKEQINAIKCLGIHDAEFFYLYRQKTLKQNSFLEEKQYVQE